MRAKESLFALQPLMVDKAMAARLCCLTLSQYDKFTKRGLLPPMNETDRVSVEALRYAVIRLDGLENRLFKDDPDRALDAWEHEDRESKAKRHQQSP